MAGWSPDTPQIVDIPRAALFAAEHEQKKYYCAYTQNVETNQAMQYEELAMHTAAIGKRCTS